MSTNDQYHAPQIVHFRETPCYSYRVRISDTNIPTGDLRAVMGSLSADKGNGKVPVRSIKAYGEWRHSATDS